MIKLSDYIVNKLVDCGVKDVFMISGGGAMHLNDSVGKCKKLKYICNHHEQASAMGAEGYSRVSGKLGVVIVTSGPGGTNTLTGVIGQWLDSIPVLYISGQIKYETCIESCRDVGLRQLGDQEINIIDIVKPVTKYAVIVKDPVTIRYHLEKAIYMATHGRPGPVWIDIPLNVQSSMIDDTNIAAYDKSEDEIKYSNSNIDIVVDFLKNSKRPVLIAGHGIRISGSQKTFLQLINKLKIPVLSTFNGFDLITTNDPQFVGRIGTLGDRAGNFALQNADLVLSIGSRNNIRQISYNWACYAKSAKKIFVDIDPSELNKSTVKPDLAINCDAKLFMDDLLTNTRCLDSKKWKSWIGWCLEKKKKYPTVLTEYKKSKGLVNPYYFVSELTKATDGNSIIVAGNGTACVVLFQAGIVKSGSRMFWNSGCASMGYDLPAAIGACFGSGLKRDVICLAGDGSLQMNIQELETVAYNKLPIKIFVLNNGGYISIKQTQDSFFNGRHVACDKFSGVGFPDIIAVAKAYGIKTQIIKNQKEMTRKINQVLSAKGPVLCEVRLKTDYIFSPKLSSQKLPDGKLVSKPLEDMYPFLPRDEFNDNILVSQ